jgi:hypothetical protein
MAAKKKLKKKTVAKKPFRKLAKKVLASKKTLAKKKAPKKVAAKSKAVAKKAVAAKTVSRKKKKTAKKGRNLEISVFPTTQTEKRSGRQSGDLQGLSRRESADSESVDELVEEGNAFEAGAITGVEDADDGDEQEVHTHQVPEDDVPGEYLDED